jgi:hypothetical protein
VASAAETELGALFLNCQEGMIFKTTLEDLGHPQPKYQYIATMRPLLELQITPLSDNDCKQWK